MSSYQSNQIKLINTSLIDPHPDNPRKNIGDVTDLAASIKTNGLLTPLSVVPNGERYRVIAGHRRLAACKQAGIVAVPCFVLQLGPLQQLEAMVTENCQREQLTVLEEADAIQGMLDLGATTASVAHRLGRSGDYVRDRVKAASIKTEVRASRDDFGQISIGQLVAIARYDGQPDRQKELTQALSTWNDAACGGEQFATISGIEPERALAELRYHLDEPDWAVWAVQILAARIEWFIDPTDWTTVNDTSRRIPGYYQILQDLGYTPTDDETSHLDQLIAAISEADSDENEEDEENNQ